MNLNPADVRIDTFRKPGASAWVASPETCVRVTHILTGVFVECCNFRSAYANKFAAMTALQKRLDEMPRAKPRIYRKYFPKCHRWYWYVSEMPKPYNLADVPAWRKAHQFTSRLNAAITSKNEPLRSWA